MIESYSFGRMLVNNEIYTSDLIIFPDRILSSWWRKTGHSLCLEDVDEVFLEKPEAVVIGTGFSGLMKVEDEVKQRAHSKGIELIMDKTDKAVHRFNELYTRKKTVGAFHLTC